MPFVKLLKVLTFMTCLFFVGQGFAAIDCATRTGWGDFLTQEATKGSDGYYEIDTPEKLAWISCKMKHDNGNFKHAKVKLTQSIDMQGNLGKVFIPIAAGTGTPPSFNGIFDGQGFTISNLYINTSEINDTTVSAFTAKSKNGNFAYAQNIGLFGIISQDTVKSPSVVIYTGTVKDLTLKDVQIYASASAGSTGINSDKPISVGTIVGWVSEGGKIENCVASGFIETSGATNRVGGVAGNVKSVTISNCVSSVSVTASGASTNVGGIVGALRNGGTVNMSSCVYSGNSLYTVDGSVGAIAGSYEKVNSLSTEDLYYSDEFCKEFEKPEDCKGIGVLPNGKTFNTVKSENLNSDSVVCALNCGTWNNGACTGDTSDVWSIGQSDISMNGSDGFKVTFVANGGSFTQGAKTSKILAKGAAVTADEIGVPIGAPDRQGMKFAGWATTANAEEPTDLGVADAAKTIYAVWYDFYEVTFKTGCDTAFSDAKFPDSTKTKTISVAKHGVVSVEGFSVPTVYEIGTGENKAKYYFTGWAYEPKSFGKDETIAKNDTLHLSSIDVTEPITLYAAWTKAATFSVTFDASLHGKTEVHFVKMITEGDTVARPDTVITDAGYKVAGWCIAEDCTEENEYDFGTPLDGNLLLHARWEMETYSIDYELDGGTNAAGNPSTYNIKSGDIVFAAPTKEGATFDGWFYNSEFTNPATQIDSGLTGNKKIYAKWIPFVYTIQYLSGNTISATAKNDVKNYGDTITLKGAPEQFAHVGCEQKGWSNVDYGQEGHGLDYHFGDKYGKNENLKVFPYWECDTLNITYEVFDASVTNNNPLKYVGPAKLTLENAYDPAKKYFFMDNWYMEPTFNTTIRDVQNINANLTVYAKWYNKVTYKPGSRLKAVNKQLGDKVDKKYFDSTYTLKSSIDKFVLANYTLDGWATTDNGEKVYELNESYTTNENLTLYPHWVESCDSVQYGAVKIYTYATDGRKEAVINGAYTGKGTIDFPTDVTVNSVEFSRTFSVNTMSTLMLPFSIDTSKVSGGKIYRFKRVEEKEDGSWKVVIGRIYTEQVGANTPYLVLPTAETMTFEGAVTLNTTTAPIETLVNGDWEYKGLYTVTNFDTVQVELNKYGFNGMPRDGMKVGKFDKIGANVTCHPLRGYLVNNRANATTKSANARFGHNLSLPDVIDIEIEDENGIVVESGRLNTITGEFRMDRWFDLKGRRLNSKPSVKGTYYKNGKKVIIK